MPSSELTSFALVIVALLILIRWSRHVRLVSSERAWRSRELRDAEIVYAEQVFKANGPVTLVAKVDRGYCDVRGVITLVELKTRHADRPYLSDVIELSAQRLAVRTQTGARVAEYGYVLTQRPGSKLRFPHRVNLLSTEEVIAVARRREAILGGKAVAQYACSQGLCSRCVFKHECKFAADPLA